MSGLSYDEIAAKCGVSKGTVANIVTDLKAGVFPEAADGAEQIELLRELSLDLKHSGLSPGRCAVGLSVLNRINECGLEASDMDRLSLVLKVVGSEEKVKEFVELVYHIDQYQKKTGLTLEQVDDKLQELEDKNAQLEPVSKQIEQLQTELTELTGQRDKLVPVVDNLHQKYSFLKPRVKDIEKREEKLSRQIKNREDAIEKAEVTLDMAKKQKNEIQAAGFSLEGLTEFNDRIRSIAGHHKIPQESVRERLLKEMETLDKGLTLEVIVDKKKAELEKYQEAIVTAKKAQVTLKATIGTLEQQKSSMEASIKATQEKVINEMVKITPVAREVIGQFSQELQLGSKAVLDEVLHLKEQALEMGREMGRYEGIIKVNEWLTELLSLARGEGNIEASRVRVILLQVLHGAESWMKCNQLKNRFVILTITIESLINELEEWQT